MSSQFESTKPFQGEQEPTEQELPAHFQALVVLGKNWREYPPKKNLENFKLRLSLESKMSSLAAGEMFQSGLIDKIIFSGGKTAGKEWPSEAEAMWKYTKKKYPDIPEDQIILEEESIDTPTNAERILPILTQNQLDNVALLTTNFHLKRSEKIFADAGIKAIGFPSEETLKKRSPHYEKFVESFLKSNRVKIEKVKEAILRGMWAIGINPSMITKKIRHAE